MPLLAIYVLSALTGVGVGIATPLIPLLLRQRGASGSDVGLAASVMFAAVGLAAFVTGPVVDRHGPKPGMVIGSLLFAAALGAMPLAAGYRWFLLLRAIEGAGIGMLTVCLEAAVNLLVRGANRGKALGTYSLVFAGGVAIGPSVGVLFPGARGVPFWIAAFVAAAAGAFVLVTFRNVVAGRAGPDMRYGGLIGTTWGPVAGVLCYALIEVAMMSLYPVYLSSLGMDPRDIGLLFALYASGAVAGPVAVGAISDRVRREGVMVASGLILALSTVLLWIAGARAPLVMLTITMGLAAGAIYPTGLAIIGDRLPADRLGSGNSFYTMAYSAGSIAGPISVGLVIDWYGAGVMFAPLAAVAAMFLALTSVDAYARGRKRHVVARTENALL
jgi:MFS family permease